MNKKALMLIFLTVACNLYANIASDLNNFLNNVGYNSNVSAPTAFNSQAAGYFGGGSLFVRNQVRTYQLVYLDLPSFRAGCSGLDFVSGSFSFISSQKLVDLGKQVMTSAGAYAVDVMLATTVPELKQVRDYLQDLQQKVNQSAINSCQLAQNLVGGVFPKTKASQEKICADQRIMGNEGLGSDYVQARMDCGHKKGFDEALAKANANPELKKAIVLNKNLVWSILQNRDFLSSDRQLAEMVMSLTGTIIFNKDGKITNVPSLADSPNLINALLGNQEKAQIYTCTEAGSSSSCLEVKLTQINIPKESSLTAHVRTYLRSMNDKLLKDQAFDSKEKSFLALCSMPVWKFLIVLNTFYGEASADLEEYATLIAHDLLQHYLAQLLQEVAMASKMAEFNEDLVKDIEQRIQSAKAQVAAIQPIVGNKLKEKLMLIDNIAKIEQQVASTIGAV